MRIVKSSELRLEKIAYKQINENEIEVVREIINDVRKNGDYAVSKYTKKFDGIELEEFKVEKEAHEDLSLDDLIARAEEAPVVKLVDLILMQAIRDRASDIHIEPFKNKINIR